MKRLTRLLLVAFVAYVHSLLPAFADGDSDRSLAPTPNLYGMLGLNTIPTARMEKPGTVRLSVAAADPYLHTQLGLQLTNRVYMGLRQTGEVSSLRNDPDHVFPGLDLKFKLLEEQKFRPAIALGLQSSFGHQRMAGEFLAFSKRYENFDFTAGVGWGRFGTRNSVPNPLDITGNFLNSDRNFGSEKPNAPKNWFTGGTGFFAGLEYATPIKGVSLKADWSSDSYKEERALGIGAPSAYSFGLSYQPTEWIDTGVALMDRNTLMARISLKSNMSQWPFSNADKQQPVELTDTGDGKNITEEGKLYKLKILNVQEADDRISGRLYLNPFRSTPQQLGQAWRIMTNKSEKQSPDMLRIEPVYFGLKAPAIAVSRRDIVEAAKREGSAEEIWRNTEFDTNLLSKKTGNLERFMPFFTLRENFSLAEDDASLLHRTDMIATLSHQTAANILTETSLRYNLFSNISQIEETRPIPFDAVRSDESFYLKRKLAVERAFVQGFKSLNTNWHVMAGAGYLEEMFVGYHGEILYRPWGKNWAMGIEAANAIKRDYETPLNLDNFGTSQPTGHLNFYYEFPDTDMTLQASIGQYLAQDRGGTLSLKNRYENGSTLEAFITATNKKDIDAYDGYANISSGIRFSLPLGSIKHVLNGSGIEVNAVPIARDAGQKLNIAHTLYDMTEPLSYRHLTQRWMDVTK